MTSEGFTHFTTGGHSYGKTAAAFEAYFNPGEATSNRRVVCADCAAGVTHAIHFVAVV